MNIGFVDPQPLDGVSVPWSAVPSWESYIDLYCLALLRRGHSCVKYVPSTGVSQTEVYRHKFGHAIKRVPVHNKLLAPRTVFRTRPYAGGTTTVMWQLLGPSFGANMIAEARRDGIQILHYTSYYSSFFIPAFAFARQIPYVAQYTGGALPSKPARRLAWRMALLPSLHAARALLVGPYRSEIVSLTSDFHVPRGKQEHFNAPIVDSSIFTVASKTSAREEVGFDPGKHHLLCVTYVPRRHRLLFAKNPYLLVEALAEATRQGGKDIALHIVGGGVGMEELREHASSLGVAKNVTLHGTVPHGGLPVYYAACDLVFVPYRLESLNEGSVTFEAFSCGRPVAAFKRHGDDPDEQPGGFLVPSSPREAGSALLSLFARPDALERKGREAVGLTKGLELGFAGRRLEEIYAKALGTKSQ